MTTPTNGHLSITSRIPNAKHTVPRSFSVRPKKKSVFAKPMTSTSPARKRMFPMARKPASKKSRIPRTMKNSPKDVSPIPISALDSRTLQIGEEHL